MNKYRDKREHFTTKENDGGECLHDTNKKNHLGKSVAELKAQQMIDLERKYNDEVSPIGTKNDISMENFNKPRDIVNYAKRVIKGEKTAQKAIVGYISEKERTAIENLTGEPLGAKYHTISRNEIIHIYKRHGDIGKADNSMENIEDYYKIMETIQDFDDIDFVYTKQGAIKTSSGYADKNNRMAKLIRFRKKLSEKVFYVVEAITDGKGKDIKIISAYQA